MVDYKSFPFETITKFWFDEVRPPIGKALEAAPEDKLDWSPADDMITLGNIFMHIAEASDWWISEITDGSGFKDYTPCHSVPKPDIAVMLGCPLETVGGFLRPCPFGFGGCLRYEQVRPEQEHHRLLDFPAFT